MIRTSIKDAWGGEEVAVKQTRDSIESKAASQHRQEPQPDYQQIQHIQPIQQEQYMPQMQHIPQMQQRPEYDDIDVNIQDDAPATEAKLLNQINQMLAESENFIIRKLADIQTKCQAQTQKSIADLEHKRDKPAPLWPTVVILVSIIILFIILFLTQHMYFARAVKELKQLNMDRVPLDVYHSNLIGMR